MKDLSKSEPKRFSALKAKWDGWADRVGVLTPAEFDAARQDFRSRQRKSKTPTTVFQIDDWKFRFLNHGVKKKQGAWLFDGNNRFDLPRTGAPQMGGKRTIRISGKFQTSARNGVIWAHGGDRAGIALYMRNGELTLAQTADWKRRVVASKPLDDDEHSFEAIRDEQGRLIVVVDGNRSTLSAKLEFPTEPGDSIQIGADMTKPVGDYEVPNQFRGRIWELKVEYGN